MNEGYCFGNNSDNEQNLRLRIMSINLSESLLSHQIINPRDVRNCLPSFLLIAKHCIQWGMLILELSSYVSEIPNDAYTTLAVQLQAAWMAPFFSQGYSFMFI